MPQIRFEASAEGPAVDVDVPEGGRLVDICDDARAPVPFSCRSASCGTCRVEVLEGADLLLPAKDDELDVLSIFGSERCRLACQAVVRPGGGLVRLRAVEE